MSKFGPLQSIFTWFSFIEQNHMIPIFNPISCSASTFYIPLKIVYLLLIMTSLIKPLRETTEERSASSYFVNGIVFIILIPSIVEVIESWLYSEALVSLKNSIEVSLDYLNTFVNMKAHISAFTRQFYRKMLLLAVLVTSEFVTRFVFKSQVTLYSSVVLSIASVYRYFASVCIIFYIDLEILILSSLNGQLNPLCGDNVNECLILPTQPNVSLVALRRIKTVYSNIWKISENVNRRFGCFLLVQLVNVAIFSIWTSIVLYINILDSSSMLTMMRKLTYFFRNFKGFYVNFNYCIKLFF